MRDLLKIVSWLRARRVVEVGHGRNLRYLKELMKLGIDAYGVEIDIQHVRRALNEGIPSVNADAIKESRWILRTLRPDLVYAVRPPVELAVRLTERYPTVALKMMEEERYELPESLVRVGGWLLHCVRFSHFREKPKKP
ncbi:UPF0146 family protein [Methanopyrus sp.]